MATACRFHAGGGKSPPDVVGRCGIAGFLGFSLLATLALPARAQTCSPISNPCDPAFSTGALDCSAVYPAAGTLPLTTGPAGFVNFGAPQVSPLLELRATATNPHRHQLFVLNTLHDEVTVLDRFDLRPIARVRVGLDPSALAQTRDGRFVLVSNWTSDSVSVIDTQRLRIVATVEHRAPDGHPLLVEPMGIAATDTTAWVASAGTNQVAVIDLAAMAATAMIDVPAVDPRAVALDRRATFLAVAGFASGNRTEGTYDTFDPSLTGIGDPARPITASCGALLRTKPGLFDPAEPALFMRPADPDFRDAFNCYLGGRINAFSSPTKLAPIVVNPRIPDHDVAIIATATGRVVATSAGMPEDPGTLNYGLAFDRRGRRLFLANTHARNDADFGHRPWRNRVTRFAVDPTTGALGWEGTSDLDLDPGQVEPTPASRAAIPYAIAPLRRGRWLVTAAASDRLLVVDDTGRVLRRLDVGFTPRGVLRSSARIAYVLNAASFTVQRWNVATGELLAEGTIGDNPLPMEERHGFHLFNADHFAVNRSFACASCHPDGDTDHLVWLLDCTDGLRLTMTLRQIADTRPYHWSGDKCNGKKIVQDGVTNLFGQSAPPADCDVDLLWQWIESLRQPPPKQRPSTDALSPDAELGLVAVNRGSAKTVGDVVQTCNGEAFDPIAWPRLRAAAGDPAGIAIQFNRSALALQGAPTTFTAGLDSEGCATSACHAAPFSGNGTLAGVALGGFCPVQPEFIEAVSFLGAHARQKTGDDGRGALYDYLVALDRYRKDVGATGGDVLDAWGVPRPSAGLKGFLATFFRHAELEYEIPGTQGFALVDRIERFVQEAATGPSAAIGRQATATPTGTPVETLALLLAAADAGKTNLLATGAAAGAAVDLLWDPAGQRFEGSGVAGGSISLADLLARLAANDAVTFTAALPKPADAPFSAARDAQPFLFAVTRASGFPVACSEGYPIQLADFSASRDGAVPLTIWALNLSPEAGVLVNGVRTGTSPVLPNPAEPFKWSWTLPVVPPGVDTLAVQLENAGGLMSNEVAALVVP